MRWCPHLFEKIPMAGTIVVLHEWLKHIKKVRQDDILTINDETLANTWAEFKYCLRISDLLVAHMWKYTEHVNSAHKSLCIVITYK